MFRIQDGIQFNHLNWRISVNENGSTPSDPNWKREIIELLPRLENPEAILKHDHRSLVGTITVAGVSYVVKKFTVQSTRVFFKLTSLMFPTLGEIAYRNGLELEKSGLLTPLPTMLMQRFEKGMVVDSWLVYKYLDGDHLTKSDAADIVNFVKRMHHAGWVHRDPHPANFIRSDVGIATIDPLKARKTRSRYLRAYDVVLMEHDLPSALELYGSEDLGIWLLVAKAGHTFLRFYRQSKDAVRKLFGIKGRG